MFRGIFRKLSGSGDLARCLSLVVMSSLGIFVGTEAAKANQNGEALRVTSSTTALPAGQARPNCTDMYADLPPNNRGSVCETWRRQRRSVLETYSDGSVLPNPLRLGNWKNDRELRTLAQQPPAASLIAEQRTHIDALRETFIQRVTQGRPESLWTDHQRYLVNRIRELRIGYADASVDTCQDTPMNANYQAASNTITLCPLAARLPRESLLPLLAHEIGHLADPCNYVELHRFRGALRNADSSMRMREPAAEAVRSCLRTRPQDDVTEVLRYLAGGNRQREQAMTLFAGDRNSASRRSAEALRACGLLEAPQVRAPSTYAQYPFLDSARCVSQAVPEDQHLNLLNTQGGKPGPTFQREPIGESTPIDNSQIRCGHPDRVSSEPDSLHDVHKECLADQIGADLLAAHIARSPQSFRERPRQDVLFFFASAHCEEAGEFDINYPRSHLRVGAYLQIPEVQNWSGCEGQRFEPLCRLTQTGAGPSAGATPAPARSTR